ncbi:hypothetical protein BUALT_Bualt04G0119800 [Buddleja alternifolia]|uniref:AB hydrolase-1 domain-containing protein n=1 Tax=Buddleja alternifolia TaxID=168488 RepID=A0AAV6XWB7_9LAMI|nr:hypothetical protein BUALT_Bualt04G0119800 [Buddleja alternifolia]
MLRERVNPTRFTYSSVLNACAKFEDYDGRKLVHAQVLLSGTYINLPLQNAMLDMYCSCGDTHTAFKVFSRIQNPDLVSWNSMIVHGACHGAWCWYKLKPLLEAVGHRVTALDLSASGIDSRNLHELRTLADYTQPLIELVASIPQEEKVVLIGHSFGGLSLGLVMDMFPRKISVAVFLAAFMPDSTHEPSYVMDQDVALAKMLLRPGSLFLEDLSKKSAFSKEGFGSVKLVYIVCTEDRAIPVNFQRWQIETIGVTEVKEIENADHMAMLSKPQQAAGHRVTTLDLSASGIDSRSLHELRMFADYTQPLIELMAAISRQEKYGERTPTEKWLDTEFLTYGTPKQPLTSMFFGPNFVASKLYQLSSSEDVALAKMLLRPSSLFLEDLSRKSAFSKEGFGSVMRVYIVCTEDRAIPVNFQRWQIETIGVAEVKEIENADHMAMLSKPQQVCQCLLEIANNYV